MYGNTTYSAPLVEMNQAQMNSAALYLSACRKGRLTSLRAKLTGRSNRLLTLAELTAGQKLHNQRHVGRRLVPIEAIQASEGRSQDFDRNFNPIRRHIRKRWLGIARARLLEIPLPLVELIKVGNNYAVRDGHHRISVARALGATHIEANVIEISLAK